MQFRRLVTNDYSTRSPDRQWAAPPPQTGGSPAQTWFGGVSRGARTKRKRTRQWFWGTRAVTWSLCRGCLCHHLHPQCDPKFIPLHSSRTSSFQLTPSWWTRYHNLRFHPTDMWATCLKAAVLEQTTLLTKDGKAQASPAASRLQLSGILSAAQGPPWLLPTGF